MIGIISDTHDNTEAVRKAVELFNERGVEIVLHAGDIISPFTAKHFSPLKAQMKCVFGNNDGDRPALVHAFAGIADFEPGWRKVVHNSLTIFLTHRPFPDPPSGCGLYVYGHTHKAEIKKGDCVILNPGECGGWVSGKRTVAVLNPSVMEVEIVEI